MTMVGADPQELRQLSQLMTGKSRLFLRVASETTAALDRTAWQGGDADRFRSEWKETLHARLTSIGTQLSTAAETLLKEADEQEQASAAGGTGLQTGGGCINDCHVPGLTDLNGALGNTAVGWASVGGSTAVMGTQLLANGLTAAGETMTTLGLVGTVAGQVPMDEFGNILSTAGTYGAAGSRLATVASAGGKLFGGLGVATGAVSLLQDLACGDGWGAADSAIGTGFAVAGLALGLATPVGWAVAGAGVLWGAAQLLSGDVPVTERVSGWVSDGIGWVGSLFD